MIKGKSAYCDYPGCVSVAFADIHCAKDVVYSCKLHLKDMEAVAQRRHREEVQERINEVLGDAGGKE